MHRTSTSPLPSHQVGFFIALLCVQTLLFSRVYAEGQWSGRIFDADGRPVPLAHVLFVPHQDSGQTHSTYSDSSGRYRLTAPTNTIGQLRVETLGYKTAVRAVDTPGESTAFDFYLQLQPLLMDELVVYRQRDEEDASFVETIAVDRSSGNDLAQLLDAATGINIRRYGGLGSFSTVSIRGSTSEQVQIFLDGVPLNSASGGGVDIGSLSLAGIERIEVHRGAVPAQFGGNSMGGVVHLRTQRLSAKRRTHLQAGGGSFSTRQLGLSQSGSWRTWQHASLVNYSASANTFRFWDDNGTEYNVADDEWATRLNSDFSALRLMSKVGRPFGARQLQVHAIFDLSNRGIPGLGNNQSLHTRFDTWSHIAEANFYGPHAHSGTFRLKAYRADQRDTYKDLLGEVGTGLQHQRNATRSYGLRGELSALLPYISLVNTFAEFRRERFAPRNALRPDSVLPTSQRSSAALGFEVETPLVGRRLAARIGGQSEHLSNRLFASDGLALGSFSPRRSSETLWGLRLGLMARLGAHLSAQAHRGTYQRAPSFFELFGDRGAVMGNADLIGEMGHNNDIGLAYRRPIETASGFSLLEVIYYHNRVDNLIRFVHNSQQVSKPYNIGEALLRGVEVRWQARAFSALALSGNYAYQRAENRAPFSFEQGNDLPNAPRHRLSNRLEYTLSAWALWYEHQRESRHFLDRANLRPVARRIIHHIGARLAVSETASLTAEMRNAGDNRIADLWGYPLPGRSYIVKLDYSFTP